MTSKFKHRISVEHNFLRRSIQKCSDNVISKRGREISYRNFQNFDPRVFEC